MFDVIVVGGGVIGGMILRELSKYELKVLMIEKENDVCMGSSKANSGIVHAGFDAKVGTNKARFNVEGSKMMEKTANELGVKYKRNGAYVVAFSDEEMNILSDLLIRGTKNGVSDLIIVSGDELRKKEPNVSDKVVGALFAKKSAIICPYELTIAAIGNAMDNGAELYTSFDTTEVKKTEDGFLMVSKDGRTVEGRIVINCAAGGAGYIASLFGDDTVKIGRRKGEYMLLDRSSSGFVNSTLFFTPTEKGKGILVSPTVDGNIILGPTAEETEDLENRTTGEGLDSVKDGAGKMCIGVPFGNVITSFTGTRIYSDRHDFVIEESSITKNLINVYGIESPGLTSSPAIAKYVVDEIIGKKVELKRNRKFNRIRTSDFFFKDLSTEEKNRLIQEDSRFGRIVCRCENVTEGEIVRVIHRNPVATTVDGVKRRIRAGMGRCQGGFCQPSVLMIISRELGIDPMEVNKSITGSEILKGRTK